MILPPKPKTRLTLLLLGIGVLAFFVFSLTFAGLAWWWLHRSNVVTGSPGGDWSHPAGETVGAGVTELFNGTDLEGWDFDPAVWSVRNGVIYGEQKRSGFTVVVSGDRIVVACGGLAPLNSGVAEVRSLVVREEARGRRLGHVIVDELRRRARAGRYRTLCAFTHDPRIFVRFGFSIVPHTWLPEKVAADCWSCERFRQCGQYAVVDTRLGKPVVPSPVREHLS